MRNVDDELPTSSIFTIAHILGIDPEVSDIK